MQNISNNLLYLVLDKGANNLCNLPRQHESQKSINLLFFTKILHIWKILFIALWLAWPNLACYNALELVPTLLFGDWHLVYRFVAKVVLTIGLKLCDLWLKTFIEDSKEILVNKYKPFSSSKPSWSTRLDACDLTKYLLLWNSK